MRHVRLVLGLSLIVASISACATRGFNINSDGKEAPTGMSNIGQFSLAEMKFDAMPLSARLSKTPWAGTYWPTAQGGIGVRWQTFRDQSMDFKKAIYAFHSPAQLRSMSTEQIAKLSAAEKYDLWNDRFDFNSSNSLANRERQNMLMEARRSKELFGAKEESVPFWAGICNGWTLSSIKEPQPTKTVTVKNNSGQTITFYPDDIKALVSQIYNDFQFQRKTNIKEVRNGREVLVKGFSLSMGAICLPEPNKADGTNPNRFESAAEGGHLILRKDDKDRPIALECRDVNPKSFHFALGQYIAKDKPFIFDREGRDQIWNQPVVGYDMKRGTPRIKEASYRNAAAGTTHLVDVDVKLLWTIESSPQLPAKTNTAEFIQSLNYHYTLELDASGKVLGGEWKPDSNIPDFLWIPQFEMDDSLFDSGYLMSYGKVSQLIKMGAGSQGSSSDNAPVIPVQNPPTLPPVVEQPAPTPTPPPAPPFITVTSPSASVFNLTAASNVSTGMKVHTDSGTVITRLGAKMGGSNMIRTQNISFNNTSGSFIKFRSTKTATVIVAVDKRATNDSWLTSIGFSRSSDAGFDVATNFVPASPYLIYTKSIAAGAEVDLPGQFVNGETGAARNYVVFVRD